jgi:hypothetical protein
MLMMMIDCKCIVGIIAGHDSLKPAMADQVFVRLKAQNKAGEQRIAFRKFSDSFRIFMLKLCSPLSTDLKRTNPGPDNIGRPVKIIRMFNPDRGFEYAYFEMSHLREKQHPVYLHKKSGLNIQVIFTDRPPSLGYTFIGRCLSVHTQRKYYVEINWITRGSFIRSPPSNPNR